VRTLAGLPSVRFAPTPTKTVMDTNVVEIDQYVAASPGTVYG
jgi:hypothetical protein